MVVRIETCNRLFPAWKSISYLNPNNILRLEVENRRIEVFTVFRPKQSAYSVRFESHKEADDFARKFFEKAQTPITNFVTKTTAPVAIPLPLKMSRMDEPSPDPLAIAALQDWEEEKAKQLK